MISTTLFLLGLSLSLGIAAIFILEVPFGRQTRLATNRGRRRQTVAQNPPSKKQASSRLLIALLAFGAGLALMIVVTLVWISSLVEGALS